MSERYTKVVYSIDKEIDIPKSRECIIALLVKSGCKFKATPKSDISTVFENEDILNKIWVDGTDSNIYFFFDGILFYLSLGNSQHGDSFELELTINDELFLTKDSDSINLKRSSTFVDFLCSLGEVFGKKLWAAVGVHSYDLFYYFDSFGKVNDREYFYGHSDFLKHPMWFYFLGSHLVSKITPTVINSAPSWRKVELKNGILLLNNPASIGFPHENLRLVADYFSSILIS